MDEHALFHEHIEWILFHEHALRLIHNDHVSSFQDILQMAEEKTIHQNNLETLFKET